MGSARFEYTRRLLVALDDVKNDRVVLASLFRMGDERIDDLIKALDDPNDKVRLNAQIVIRYLGNESGLNELFEVYARSQQVTIAGAIPLPLRKWDYDYIETFYLRSSPDWDNLSERYVFALALDDSAKSKELLDRVMASAANLDEGLIVDRAIKLVQDSKPNKVFSGNKELATLVLENAFFVAPADLIHTSAKVLALNTSKDKALVEVYINRGTLAEEWYHVIIRKTGQGWKFFSITQVAMS